MTAACTVQRRLLVGASIVGLTLATTLEPARAQQATSTATNSASADQTPQKDSAGLEEIVVTAEKRSERLSDVPMSVTAVSRDQLTQLGVRDVSSLVKVSPGLNYVESIYGTPVYSIRGIGFYDSSLASTPAVTVYDDQVSLPYPQQTRNAFFDLERLEVLKGPQGTLFGQNSTGGAINLIARKPTTDLSYGVDLTYGRFNSLDATAYVSGPVASGVTARLAVGTRQSDDWQYSYTHAGSRGQTNILQGRFLLDWETGPLRAELAANGWRDQSDPQAAQLIAVTPNIPSALDPQLAVYPHAPENDRAADFSRGVGKGRHDDFGQLSLRADYDISGMTLTSITSYSHLNIDYWLDGDGTELEAFEPQESGSIRTVTQELRVDGDVSSWGHFIAGGNYQNDSITDNVNLFLADGSTAREWAPLPIYHTMFYGDTTARTYAAFGNVDVKLTRSFTLQGGVRYTEARRHFSGCLLDDPSDNGALFTLFQGLSDTLRTVSGLPPVAFQRGGCLTLGPTFAPYRQVADLDEHNMPWRGSANWKVTDDTLLYVSVSKGYKAGEFGTFGATNYYQYQPVKQESVLAYELGAKSPFLDRTLEIDAAVFYYDYRDKQLRGNILLPIFGPLETVLNIPKSHVYGAELNVTLRPTAGLTLRAGGTYVRSRVDGTFDNFTPYGVPTNFGGQQFPYTPNWQLMGDAQYDFPLANGFGAFVGGNALYVSRTEGAFAGGPLLNIKSYATLDLRAGIISPNGHWRASLWGQNVTNTYYYTNAAFAAPDTTVRYTGRPATFGIGFNLAY